MDNRPLILFVMFAVFVVAMSFWVFGYLIGNVVPECTTILLDEWDLAYQAGIAGEGHTVSIEAQECFGDRR